MKSPVHVLNTCLLIASLALLSGNAFATPWTAEGVEWEQGCWKTVGKFDSASGDTDKPGFRVKEYVPSDSIVDLFFTNRGNVIKNKDDSVAYLRCDNTGKDEGFTDNFTLGLGLRELNGKKITDIKQTTKFNPEGTLQAAAFDISSGDMFSLPDWIVDRGYIDKALGVPDFVSISQTELFFGVSLEIWEQEEFIMSTSSIASTYQVDNGVITNRLSGLGPTASQLSSFIFSNTDLTADAGAWTTTNAYSGTVELFGWHEFDAVPIPEPNTLYLLIGGMLFVLFGVRFQQRRT